MAEAIQKQFKAVLIGATGATGRYLFAELLQAKVIILFYILYLFLTVRLFSLLKSCCMLEFLLFV